MAKSEQQKQRKLAKKKSKERGNRKLVAQRQQQMSSMAGQMSAAASGSVDGCYIARNCHNGTGIGSVLIVRRLASGQRALAMFLVDAFCLGVKDAFGRIGSASQLSEFTDDLKHRDPVEPVEPGVARAYVEAAIEYAKSLGIAPHSDYRKVAPIWGDIEAVPLPAKYEFGRDGCPVYINGPHEDPVRQQMVLNALTKSVGDGNFHFMLGGPIGFDMRDEGNLVFDDDDFDDEEVFDDDDDNDNVIDDNVVQRIDRGIHDAD